MTEAKWLANTEPSLMLLHLEGKVSERKLRLFSCACWRRSWDFLDRSKRFFVEVSEFYADGLSSGSDLCVAAAAATPGERFATAMNTAFQNPAEAAAEARAVLSSVACLPGMSEGEERRIWKQVMQDEAFKQCELLRCISGNPFRPPNIPDDVRAWNDCALVKMAQAIYDGRRWGEIPILADALEDAGCTDVVLLDHCRTPTDHARGCHVLDALLTRT